MLPNEHLIHLFKQYPQAGQRIETFLQGRGVDLPKWESWCFLPMAAWYAIVSEQHRLSRLPVDIVGDVANLAAIGAWRYSQGIYRFAPEFYNAIISTVPNGDLPCEVLYRLPEWSVYIETPNMQWLQKPLHGFWCHLEWDVESQRHELRLLLNTNKLIAIPLHLGQWTITEALARSTAVARQNLTLINAENAFSDDFIETTASNLYPLISLILYLCSDEPEIDSLREPGISPERPSYTKTKNGLRLFPAVKPRVWDGNPPIFNRNQK